MIPRLKKKYFELIRTELMQIPGLSYKNKYQVPVITKIVINRGLGDASQNEQILKSSLLFIQNYELSMDYTLNF